MPTVDQLAPPIPYMRDGAPRLRRTAWLVGDGRQWQQGLAGVGMRALLGRFGQAGESVFFDVYQLQLAFQVMHRRTGLPVYNVPVTGVWSRADLDALTAAAASDPGFVVDAPEGATVVFVFAGSDKALAGWQDLEAQVAALPKRPVAEPEPAPEPVKPPAEPVIPADAAPIAAADAAIQLKAIGYFAGSLARPSESIGWAEVEPAFARWAGDRRLTFRAFADPSNGPTSRLISPGSVLVTLIAEAERVPDKFEAAMHEHEVFYEHVPRVSPIWGALLVGGIVVGGVWALSRGKRRMRSYA